MTANLIDISMPISGRSPAWPGSPGAEVSRLKSIAAGVEAQVSSLTMDIHTGTHLDAPSHMIEGGASFDDYALERGVGEAVVLDVGDADRLDAETLEPLLPPGAQRVLLRTRNSADPGLLEGPFSTDFAALTLSGAECLIEHGVELVGIDSLSIQLFGDPIDTHLALFRAGVTILEGLYLAGVTPGRYELLCLPLRLLDCEGAPARAVLRPLR